MSLLNLILICEDSYTHRSLVPFSQITFIYPFVCMCVCIRACVYTQNTHIHHLPVNSNAYLKWMGSSHLKDKVYIFMLNPSLTSQHCFFLCNAWFCFFFFSCSLWTCGLLCGNVLRYMGRDRETFEYFLMALALVVVGSYPFTGAVTCDAASRLVSKHDDKKPHAFVFSITCVLR